ncbi:MAG TPA: methyltransferase domain-containing protein [Caulobacteraceae bacterium]|jgi:SAM-dependent methyltransferase|nr:methyltransferase domain-containing protein [Caulobacteraceae bacterium]
MRRDVLELREFYAQPLGRAVRDLLSRKVGEKWGDAAGLDVLGLGYATPFLDRFAAARRVVAAMPAAQGVETWPSGARNRACLVEDAALPFQNALFDRILIVHGLEESETSAALLCEAGRVLAPSGRIIVIAAARGGLWSHAVKTPFGHGRPFTRGQLETLVREADLEPVAWSQALYVPPWTPLMRWADGFEQVGSRVWPGSAGLVLLEAVKRTFALRAKPVRAKLANPLPGVLAPQPTPAPAGMTHRRLRSRR